MNVPGAYATVTGTLAGTIILQQPLGESVAVNDRGVYVYTLLVYMYAQAWQYLAPSNQYGTSNPNPILQSFILNKFNHRVRSQTVDQPSVGTKCAMAISCQC